MEQNDETTLLSRASSPTDVFYDAQESFSSQGETSLSTQSSYEHGPELAHMADVLMMFHSFQVYGSLRILIETLATHEASAELYEEAIEANEEPSIEALVKPSKEAGMPQKCQACEIQNVMVTGNEYTEQLQRVWQKLRERKALVDKRNQDICQSETRSEEPTPSTKQLSTSTSHKKKVESFLGSEIDDNNEGATSSSPKSGSLMNVARAMKNWKKFGIDGFRLMDKLLVDFEQRYPNFARSMDPTQRERRFKNGTVHNYCKVMCIFPDAKDAMKRAIGLAKLERDVHGGQQIMESGVQCKIPFEHSGGRVEEQEGMAAIFETHFLIAGTL
ncbi:hypothetical protein BDZ45DRAFT_689595 [Acephala macrosclerotiorum]|nr:hypothetical protein BDZ45DRAFT_689595 [Acephala macrosclerotiorum]